VLDELGNFSIISVPDRDCGKSNNEISEDCLVPIDRIFYSGLPASILDNVVPKKCSVKSHCELSKIRLLQGSD